MADNKEKEASVSVQAAVDAMILGTNLRGMLSKTTAQKDGKEVPVMEFLIMPSDGRENEPIEVQEVVDEINRMIYNIQHNTVVQETPDGPVKEDSVETALGIVGLSGAELSFTQTYIYYKKVGDDDNAETTKEFALGLHVHSQKRPKVGEFNFLQIHDVYINVWDTKRQKVLDKMEIWSTDQLE